MNKESAEQRRQRAKNLYEMQPAVRKGAEQRRQELLGAALPLFAAHGFEGTTTRAIADAAGVTEALIFHYFPTKLALFQAIIADHGFQSLHEFDFSTLAGKSLPEILTALLNMFLNTMWKNRIALRLMYSATANELNTLQGLTTFDTRPRERLELLLGGYEKVGMIAPGTAPRAAKIISAAVLGFLVASLRSEPENWETARTDFVNDLITLILPGLQPPAETL
ncbi:MAG: TetR family transcriptional regulator [Chthonomonadales bacterium]|nr:TetR family transcriptional regulator [Chthonomonadales bacterium]